MNFALLVVVAWLSFSCATATKQTDKLVKDKEGLPQKSKIINVPLFKQESFHCGPASLAMVMTHAGGTISMSELSSQVITSNMKGSFKTDMLSAIRRQGFLAIPIKDLKSMITEVSVGVPVVVFQNLGFSWWPQWHYAVVTGHDFSGPDIILHTGDKSYKKMDMRLFERSWILGGHWSYLVLQPGQISVTADEKTHVEAASMLEVLGSLRAAQIAFERILKRWPTGLGALLGLGNVSYQFKKYSQSVQYLEKAVKFHPASAIAWHNLATAQGAAGKKSEAKKSAIKAVELVDEENQAVFKESLKSLLI